MEHHNHKVLTPLDRQLWTILITTTIVYTGFSLAGALVERFYPESLNGYTTLMWMLGCTTPFLGVGLLVVISLVFFHGAPGRSLIESHPVIAGLALVIILALVIVMPLVGVAAGVVPVE